MSLGSVVHCEASTFGGLRFGFSFRTEFSWQFGKGNVSEHELFLPGISILVDLSSLAVSLLSGSESFGSFWSTLLSLFHALVNL